MSSICVLPTDQAVAAVKAALTPGELKSLDVDLFRDLYTQATSDPAQVHIFIGGPHLLAVIMDSCVDATLGTARAAEIGGKIVRTVVASVVEKRRREAILTVTPIFRRFRSHRHPS